MIQKKIVIFLKFLQCRYINKKYVRMVMELKQLKSYIAVVECLSFTKAAKKLFLSQPTVSTHIQKLEEELHTRLIKRTTKQIEVTPRGQELYDCACEMLKRWDNLQQHWDSETRKIIRIGASTIPSAYILPQLLPAYGNTHPGTYFSIYQSNSQEIIARMQQGDFDIGLIGMHTHEDSLACIPFYQDRMVIITPVNEYFLSLKQQEPVPLKTLLRSPVILREKRSGSRKSADRFLESLHIQEKDLQVAARINDQEAIKNLVAQGLGISILSECAARNFEQEKRILVFALTEKTAQRSLCVIYPKNDMPHPCLQQFISYVLQYGAE